jgi:hypothetical protein
VILFNKYEFYSEVVNGSLPLRGLFNNLSSCMTADDYNELFDELSIEIHSNLNLHQDFIFLGNSSEENIVAEKKSKRVRLSLMLLSMLSMGATYNEGVFLDSMNFILKKELSSATLNLN